MTLYGHSDLVCAFVAGLIPGCERGFANGQGVGYLDASGNLVAGVVYHNWAPENEVIEISEASACRNWLNRDILAEIFDYPFAIGCRMVVARIGENNRRARRIWRSLGSDEYVIPALRSPTEAEVIFTLTLQQWQKSKFSR